MPKCFICNKYIYLYIYINLLHFVANEDKYYIRFVEDPSVKFEFEFELYLNCDGGQGLSKQIKNQKNLELDFNELEFEYGCQFPLLNEQSSIQEQYQDVAGQIVACQDSNLYFVYKDSYTHILSKCQIIGKVINKEEFSERIVTLPHYYNEPLSLVLAYEKIEKPDETKISEINKKIISIIIIGLIILIILLIIKLIVK